MDRFLRSLLTSSGAADMDGDKSLSDIARSVLVDSPDGDARSLREKAGLIALLNLLGIVESFYGEASESVSRETKDDQPGPAGMAPATQASQTGGAAAPGDSAVQTGSAPPPTGIENPLSMVSGLARMLSSVMGSPQAGAQQAGGSPPPASGGLPGALGGLDPALIASMLGLVSAMAKTRPQVKAPTKVVATEAQAPAEGGPDVEFPAAPADEGQAEPQEKPAAGQSPASPLQQILGIDPRVLTIILNLVADLMKNRPAGAPASQAPAAQPQVGSTAQAAAGAQPPASAAAAAHATAQSPDGAPVKEAAEPAPKRISPPLRRYHRPGLGIYRGALGGSGTEQPTT